MALHKERSGKRDPNHTALQIISKLAFALIKKEVLILYFKPQYVF